MEKEERSAYNREYKRLRMLDPEYRKRVCEQRKQRYEKCKKIKSFMERKRKYMRAWRARKKIKKNSYMEIMKNWDTWHPLPYDDLFKMTDSEHKFYCAWYMKCHPGLGNGLSWNEFTKLRIKNIRIKKNDKLHNRSNEKTGSQ